METVTARSRDAEDGGRRPYQGVVTHQRQRSVRRSRHDFGAEVEAGQVTAFNRMFPPGPLGLGSGAAYPSLRDASARGGCPRGARHRGVDEAGVSPVVKGLEVRG
jgi:hypothetical protein